MPLQAAVQKRVLHFKFVARTSRGAMPQHEVYYLSIWDTARPDVIGVGECAPLPGLSPEHGPHYAAWLNDWVKRFSALQIEGEELQASGLEETFNLENWPSVRFGVETAFLDWQQNGRKILFDNYFSRSENGIPINGLIWMGDSTFMQQQIEKKLQEGYSCLKLKIGGLDFNTELRILRQIREVAAADSLIIRLDANGAFQPAEALLKLQTLARYDIHSIEQPIKPQQPESMAALCRQSPIPVALDEELIGVTHAGERRQLLSDLKPAYIILKPTLLGGMAATREWITLAENQNVGWWLTSALESNIGLNAISQFAAEFKPEREQGLGTGQLYHNNIPSPLQIQEGKLFYNAATAWEHIADNT